MTRARSSRRKNTAETRIKSDARGPWVQSRHYRVLHLVVLGLGFVACGLVSLLLGQDNNWDLQNYHAYNAFAFLNDRLTFDVAPAQRQSYLNPIADVPFYLGSNHLPPRLFGFLMGGIQGLVCGLVFWASFVALRRFRPNLRVALSLVCAGLGAYGPVFISELGGSENDTLVSLLVLASVCLYVTALAEQGTLAHRSSRRCLILGSLVLGVGVGLKLTVMPHALAVVAAIMVAESAWRSRIRALATSCAMFLAGFLSVSGYWMVRLWHEFGNPLFPFYNNVFRSPWAEPRSFADISMLPTNPLQAVAVPFVLSFQNPFTARQAYRDARFTALWILVIVLVAQWVIRRVSRRRKGTASSPQMPADHRFLFVFFVVSFVVWEAAFNFLRYTACIEALAPLLIVIAVCALWSRTAVRVVLISAMLVAIAVNMKPIRQERIAWGRTFWQVHVPDVPANTLVIIANSRPLAYLVPRFPPEVRWVSVMNNLTDPSRPTRMQEEIQRIIAVHQGPMYLLTRAIPYWLEHDAAVLTAYNLELGAQPALPIETEHSPSQIKLVALQRRTPSPAGPSP